MMMSCSRRRFLASAAGAAMVAAVPVRGAWGLQVEDGGPEPLPRVRAYESLAFGLFMHFGLYSLWGRGEWFKYHEGIGREEYFARLPEFSAKEFDARAIARMAKQAGMRYMCLTSRHHDGFSLYDTRGLSAYDVTKSACGRDLILEFCTAAREEGLKPFLYHTTLDWTDDRFNKDFPAYLAYLRASVEILCTQYGELGGLWFDGNWSKPDADWQEGALYETIRKHQPQAIIINNTGIDARGKPGHPEIDGVTFEVGRPEALDQSGRPKHLAAEMCQTMQGVWGWGRLDFGHKSVPALIDDLCACRRVGANFLLNTGPTATGAITELDRAVLLRMGEWAALWGDALYEGRPSRVGVEGDAFVLEAPGRLLVFTKTPGKALVLRGVTRAPHRARWLDNGEEFAVEVTDDGVTLRTTGARVGCNYIHRCAEVTLV